MDENLTYKPSAVLQTLHIEHLSAQYDHLLLVRDRHLQWIGETDDIEIREIHHVLVSLLEQVASQYEHLIQELQKRQDQG